MLHHLIPIQVNRAPEMNSSTGRIKSQVWLLYQLHQIFLDLGSRTFLLHTPLRNFQRNEQGPASAAVPDFSYSLY